MSAYAGDAAEPPPEQPRALHGRHDRAATRRQSRILALQALYEADTSGHDPAEVVLRLSPDGTDQAEPAAYAARLIAGIKARRHELDDRIAHTAPQWPVEQLAVIDRNLLRIAIYELLFEPDTPIGVAVNEAVELAKAFGAQASGRFVNGVLGAISAGRSA